MVGTPTTINKNKNQVEILKEYLNCRDNYSLSGKVLGFANIGYYDILDKKQADGYTWYRIDYNKWVADIKDYVKVLNKEEQIIPAPTPTKPKNFDKYNSFTALKDGYYYIYLKQNEEIYYPKQKDSK